jgi:hypothetical protein
MTTQPGIRLCAKRKTNGLNCASPALKDKPYCYFHDRNRDQHIDVINGTPMEQSVWAELPVLEDPESIQMALSKVFHMLMAGLLEPKFARTLTYLLNTAAMNLKLCNFKPKPEEVRDNSPALAEQSVTQNAYGERVEKDEYSLSEAEKEDAAWLAKFRASHDNGCPTSGAVPDVGSPTKATDSAPSLNPAVDTPHPDAPTPATIDLQAVADDQMEADAIEPAALEGRGFNRAVQIRIPVVIPNADQQPTVNDRDRRRRAEPASHGGATLLLRKASRPLRSRTDS